MNRLESRVEAIEAAPTDACLSTINVAQFDDYEQYFDSGPISALDIDNAAPDWRVGHTNLLIADRRSQLRLAVRRGFPPTQPEGRFEDDAREARRLAVGVSR